MGRYSADMARPFIEKKKHLQSRCVYCGEYATTREHIPSRVFLDEPYPFDLTIVPACLKCNNSFSRDEQYVACLTDYVRFITSNQSVPLHNKTSDMFLHDSVLRDSIEIVGDNININFDTYAIESILFKLARGHISSNNDISYQNKIVLCKFSLGMLPTNGDWECFNDSILVEATGEIGSDYTHNLLVVTSQDLESEVYSSWNDIQEGNYRLLVLERDSKFIVRIVIFETLYAELVLH
jgi:hypothetical protein